MFIHLGGERIIRTSEVIAIFDVSIQNQAKISGIFASDVQNQSNIEFIGDEEPKSVVLTESKIYYSPISSSTLKKRAQQVVVL